MLMTPGRAPPRLAQISGRARPMVALARVPGPRAPAAQLSSIVTRAGPLTMKMGATASVVPEIPTRSNASSHIARTAATTTGMYSGRQPAITALIAIFSIVARPLAGAALARSPAARRSGAPIIAAARARAGGPTGTPAGAPTSAPAAGRSIAPTARPRTSIVTAADA